MSEQDKPLMAEYGITSSPKHGKSTLEPNLLIVG